MTKSSNVYRGLSAIVLPPQELALGWRGAVLDDCGGRSGGEHVDGEELVGPGRGVDDQLDRRAGRR